MTNSAVVVIGGGIIGLSCAWRLAQRGCTVTLLDAAAESREASWAAAGMLAPHHEADAPGPLWALGQASLERWPRFVADLVADPMLVDFRQVGGWLPWLENEDTAAVVAKEAFLTAAGVAVRRLGRREIGAAEPAFCNACAGALLLPAGQVIPRLVVSALQAACRRLGVHLRFGARVARVDGPTVHLGDGAAVSGEVVVLASGAWTPELARHSGVDLSGEPVKGQMLRLGADDRLLRHFVHSNHGYLVPRLGCGIVVGSTMVSDGFDRRDDPQAIARLAASAGVLVPALARAPIIETWTGLRPRLHGGLPVIDRVSPTLVLATGHFRNGILLTPITAEAVAAIVMQDELPKELADFTLAAFQVRH